MPEQGDPNVDPNPDPTLDPEPARSFTQEEVDRIVKDRLARAKATPPADYEEAKRKAALLDQLEEAQATELEKAQKMAADAVAERDKILADAKETRLRAAIIAEAAKSDRKVVDPEAVVALLDRSALELADDGTPTNIAAAMDSLLEARPYLVAKQEATRGSADQGARDIGGIKQMTDAELKALHAAGKHDEIAQARREGRLASLLGAS